jgi:phosphatidate cytidylyltransferase
MTRRILTAIIAGTGWLLLLFVAPLSLFWVAFMLVGGIIAWEFATIILGPKEGALKPAAVALLLLPLLASCTGRLETLAAVLVVALLLLTLVVISRHAVLPDPFSLLLRMSFGLVLVGFFLAHIALIMRLPEGHRLLLFLSCITVVSDSAAFFIGKSLGRHKLCPTVSPKKTIEGFMGGLLGGAAGGLIVSLLFFPGFALIRVIMFSALLAAVGVLGDLTESMLKRQAGVKDSGTILPGHGGLLDRVDSLLLAAPAFYYLHTWHLIF